MAIDRLPAPKAESVVAVVLALLAVFVLVFSLDQPAADTSHPVNSVVEQTLARLIPEEGFSAKPYLDSNGILTIGIGTNIGEGITRREAEFLLRERLAVTYQTLTADLPWLSDAPERQQSAILDMGYQVGVHGLLKFHGMLSALESGDCPAAKAAALDSAWARETPERAKRVTAILCEN